MGRMKQALAALDRANERIDVLERDLAGVKEGLAAVKASLRSSEKANDRLWQIVREGQGVLAGALERAQEASAPVVPAFGFPDGIAGLSAEDEELAWQKAQGLITADQEAGLDAARAALERHGMDADIDFVNDPTID